MELLVIQDITSNAIGGLISSTIAGIFLLTLRFYIRRQDQSLEKRELIIDIKNKTYRSTAFLFFYTLGLLQFSWTVTIFGVIAILGQYFGEPDSGWEYMLTTVSTVLIMAIVMIPISVRLYHRLHKDQPWIKLAVIAATYILTITEVSLIVGEFPRLNAVNGITVLFVVAFVALLPGMYAGQWIARRTQSSFTMTQLFKRLPAQDKKELIELVDSLPSVSVKKSK